MRDLQFDIKAVHITPAVQSAPAATASAGSHSPHAPRLTAPIRPALCALWRIEDCALVLGCVRE
jgi:hypothetical protein